MPLLADIDVPVPAVNVYTPTPPVTVCALTALATNVDVLSTLTAVATNVDVLKV